MKKTLITTALLALLGGAGPGGVRAGPITLPITMVPAPRPRPMLPLAEGTVKKIDKSAGKLTIAHGLP